VAAIAARSDFTAGTEGWVLSGDAITAEPTWLAAGGNPGGYLNGVDRTVGGVWYWQAPPSFLGDHSASYGESLAFDLRMRGSGPLFESSDVVISGGGLALHVELSPVPDGTTWTAYAVRLDPSAGWKVGSLAGAAATGAQLQSVLGNITALRIRGEFITGSDNGDLDNVVLTAVPEPRAYVLLAAGLGLVAWAGRRRRVSRG